MRNVLGTDMSHGSFTFLYAVIPRTSSGGVDDLGYSNGERMTNGKLNDSVELGICSNTLRVSDAAGGGAAKAKASRRRVLTKQNK